MVFFHLSEDCARRQAIVNYRYVPRSVSLSLSASRNMVLEFFVIEKEQCSPIV